MMELFDNNGIARSEAQATLDNITAALGTSLGYWKNCVDLSVAGDNDKVRQRSNTIRAMLGEIRRLFATTTTTVEELTKKVSDWFSVSERRYSDEARSIMHCVLSFRLSHDVPFDDHGEHAVALISFFFFSSSDPVNCPGETHSIEVFRHWCMVELLRLRNFYEAEQQQPNGRAESGKAQHSEHASSDHVRGVKVHKNDSVVKVGETATFFAEHKPMKCVASETLDDSLKLVLAMRDQFSQAGLKPEIVVTMQCADRDMTLRVARQSDTQIIGHPIVAFYKLPERADDGAASLDLDKWLDFVDVMLCVVPYAVQLPLRRNQSSAVALVTPTKTVGSSYLFSFHYLFYNNLPRLTFCHKGGNANDDDDDDDHEDNEKHTKKRQAPKADKAGSGNDRTVRNKSTRRRGDGKQQQQQQAIELQLVPIRAMPSLVPLVGVDVVAFEKLRPRKWLHVLWESSVSVVLASAQGNVFKCVRRGFAEVARREAEMHALASAVAPTCVVPLLGVYEPPNGHWQAVLVMPRGEPLALSALSHDAKLRALEQMLCALVELHRAGIVHGDVKPSNFVLLDGAARCIDFEHARLLVPTSPDSVCKTLLVNLRRQGEQ